MKQLSEFEGRWSVARVITDARAGLEGRFEGEAIWSPDADGLVQEERGVLHYGSAPPMQATRRYLWRQEAGALRVLFEDGRAFHTVPTDGSTALHDCPPDTYRVQYEFNGSESFITRWRVTGPRKDAILLTQFTRV